ncbi:hypothetical protein [Mangrovibacillus cuniculi]|uniref:Apea-like HEPN domain-containing protein n=1 Tax=Mangrovibacillus cuniculi TaxID=2593652 RepID=A0A7S8CAI3_9BACI|nr:hypothetical protein [Mangrovibacillus cuniculi]QPC46424.1 hypothetical protein G8O30_05315 [Mangrovibacillus cuniculi]
MQIIVNATTIEDANEWLWFVFTYIKEFDSSATFYYNPKKLGSIRRIQLGSLRIEDRLYHAELQYEKLGTIHFIEWFSEKGETLKSSHPLIQWMMDKTRVWESKNSDNWKIPIGDTTISLRARWESYAQYQSLPISNAFRQLIEIADEMDEVTLGFNINLLCKPTIQHALTLFQKGKKQLIEKGDIELGVTLLISSIEIICLQTESNLKRCSTCGQIEYSIGDRVVDFYKTHTSLSKKEAEEWYSQRSKFIHTGNFMTNDVQVPRLDPEDVSGCVRIQEGNIEVFLQETTKGFINFLFTLSIDEKRDA